MGVEKRATKGELRNMCFPNPFLEVGLFKSTLITHLHPEDVC